MALEQIGSYRVERCLGSGAFATVWLAYDDALDARVAIKILAENWVGDLDIRRRFTEEARILWRLDSDRMVRVYAVQELADGRPYFVMEYADRGSLEERMTERLRAFSAFTPTEAISLSLDLARGLEVAHQLGFAHRDLKPSNVLFRSIAAHHLDTRAERLLLADFGIARALESDRRTTIAAGTPHYMAPEQFSGHADGRSDIYAAAVIFYELLSGQVPYPADSIGDLIRSQMSGPPPAVRTFRPDVPEELESLIRRGLAIDPDERIPTVAEWSDGLSQALQAASAPPPAPPPPPPPPPPAPPPASASAPSEPVRIEAAAPTVMDAVGPPQTPQPPPAPPQPPAAPPPPVEPNPAIPPAVTDRGPRPLGVIAGAGAAVAVIVAVVIFVLARPSGKPSPSLSAQSALGPDPFTTAPTVPLRSDPLFQKLLASNITKAEAPAGYLVTPPLDTTGAGTHMASGENGDVLVDLGPSTKVYGGIQYRVFDSAPDAQASLDAGRTSETTHPAGSTIPANCLATSDGANCSGVLGRVQLQVLTIGLDLPAAITILNIAAAHLRQVGGY